MLEDYISFALYTPSDYEFILNNGRSVSLTLRTNPIFGNNSRVSSISILCILWVLGSVIGVLLVSNATSNALLCFRSVVSRRTSWLLLFTVAVLPLLLCSLALQYSWFVVNCVLFPFISFCRGFCGFSLFICFGSGAWLLRSGLLLSSTTCSVLMWWLVFKHYLSNTVSLQKDTCITVVILTLFTLVDRFWVSPLLFRLSLYI